MKDAQDPDALTVGVDASVLIDLAKGRALGVLKEIVAPVAVPALVKEEILRGKRFTATRPTILGFSGALVVAAEHEDDLQLISDLHQVWGSIPPKNDGEAELIALARRHRWIAVLEEESARRTAILEGVHVARFSTCIVAAVACGQIEADRAWRLHTEFHSRHSLHTKTLSAARVSDRAVFDALVDHFTDLHERAGSTTWPELLMRPGLRPGDIDSDYERVRNLSPH